MSVAEILFAAANLAIFFGYVFVATAIAPYFKVESRRTRWAGVVFFATCGMTHAELALHMIMEDGLDVAEMTSWHMLGVHIAQAFAVWFFVTGLYSEFVQGDGEMPIQRERRILQRRKQDRR